MSMEIINVGVTVETASEELVVGFDAPKLPGRIVVGTYLPPFDSAVYERQQTCEYLPDVMHSYFDEDDVEHDTAEADPDGCHCSCSVCGNTMMTGELGWFDESAGEHGGIVYTPRFRRCPECGAHVVGASRWR